MLGYFNEGPNLVTMAMNGWGTNEPAWWLNLQANPEARVHTVGGRHLARGRALQSRRAEGPTPATVDEAATVL